MQKLITGIHHFQKNVFTDKRVLFNQLADGQKPSALVITCSDSRICPNLLTQTDPGEIFLLRNAGNIIPAAPHVGGELATIEFAIKGLGIQDIIICGHSDCGAIKGLLSPEQTAEALPAVSEWLKHAKRTYDIMNEEYDHLEGRSRLMTAIEENVLVQMENLKTHDFIAERVKSRQVFIHGWVYKFETGEVFSYDRGSEQFQKIHISMATEHTQPANKETSPSSTVV